jgi:hypothetical protein
LAWVSRNAWALEAPARSSSWKPSWNVCSRLPGWPSDARQKARPARTRPTAVSWISRPWLPSSETAIRYARSRAQHACAALEARLGPAGPGPGEEVVSGWPARPPSGGAENSTLARGHGVNDRSSVAWRAPRRTPAGAAARQRGAPGCAPLRPRPPQAELPKASPSLVAPTAHAFTPRSDSATVGASWISWAGARTRNRATAPMGRPLGSRHGDSGASARRG